MKPKWFKILVLVLLISVLQPTMAYAEGEGNIDNGGGGMGSGSSQNYWNVRDEGVRITVIRASDHAIVTTPVDFTNKKPNDIKIHFGKNSKMAYTGGKALTPTTSTYNYFNPGITMPRIISSGSGQASIAAIKQYFCSEYILMRIAQVTGMNYDVLINGQYKLLLEPIAYITFGGIRYAMTATEAALFDQQLGGGLRSKMVSLSHKNLPLAMFLETADLGYPAWSGSITTAASNTDIISSLGLGIVRFNEAEADPEPTEVSTADYEYRIDTEVITSVTVRGGQADPDSPITVRFTIGSQTYTVSNIYYPEGDSQLVWVRWTTPSAPQTMSIKVSVSGGGAASQGTITAKIVDLSGNDPPDPEADDRNDSYTASAVPVNGQKASVSWGIWRPWWQAHWVWYDGDDEDDNGYWEDEGWWGATC